MKTPPDRGGTLGPYHGLRRGFWQIKGNEYAYKAQGKNPNHAMCLAEFVRLLFPLAYFAFSKLKPSIQNFQKLTKYCNQSWHGHNQDRDRLENNFHATPQTAVNLHCNMQGVALGEAWLRLRRFLRGVPLSIA